MTDSDLMADLPVGDMDDALDECGVIEVVAMHASMTAIGSVSAEEFEATQCAIGSASVDGDVSVSASAIGALSANSVGIHQGMTSVMVVDGDVSIDQGAAQFVMARTVGIEQGGVGTLIASEANLARSWVGVMAARNATLSDDSRVIVGTRAAIIIGAGLLGGLAAVALAVFFRGHESD
jgi:hypothetical protein